MATDYTGGNLNSNLHFCLKSKSKLILVIELRKNVLQPIEICKIYLYVSHQIFYVCEHLSKFEIDVTGRLYQLLTLD